MACITSLQDTTACQSVMQQMYRTHASLKAPFGRTKANDKFEHAMLESSLHKEHHRQTAWHDGQIGNKS